MTHTVAELNQVKVAILCRGAAEHPTRRQNAHWDKAAGDEWLTRHTLVNSVDRERQNGIDPEAQK